MVHLRTLMPRLAQLGSVWMLGWLLACGEQPSSFVTDSSTTGGGVNTGDLEVPARDQRDSSNDPATGGGASGELNKPVGDAEQAHDQSGQTPASSGEHAGAGGQGGSDDPGRKGTVHEDLPRLPTLPPVPTLPGFPMRTIEVRQPAASKIDILWVVDNSASMAPEQDNLATNFNTFITQLSRSGHDFHTAVTTTDICQERIPEALSERVCPVANIGGSPATHLRGAFIGAPGRTVLRSTDSDLVTRFNSYVRRGTDGSSFEHGLTAAQLALDRSLHGKNEEFVRNEAFLAVIVVSDEEDDGIGLGMSDASTKRNFWAEGITRYRYTEGDLIAYLRLIKGVGRFSVSGIVGTRDPSGRLCSSPVASPLEEGTQYIKAAQQTGGIIRSVCEVNWAESMLKIAQDVSAQAAQVNLPSYPDAKTILVTVDGTASSAWTYNVANNAVKFDAGQVPHQGAAIKITYTEAR